MKCPKCKAPFSKSKLQFEVGICNDCNYRIWKKKIPGKGHVPSLVAGALVLVAFLVMNLMPRPVTESITSGTGKTGSSFGVPFPAVYHWTNQSGSYEDRPIDEFAFDHVGVVGDTGCALAVTLLGWFFALVFFRHAWFEHHFAPFEEEDDESPELDGNVVAAQLAGKSNEKDSELVRQSIAPTHPEDDSEFSVPNFNTPEVLIPNVGQLKMMATGAKLVFISGWFIVIFFTAAFLYSILNTLANVSTHRAIPLFFLIAMPLDLVGRLYFLYGSRNSNEKSACVGYLMCCFLTAVFFFLWVGKTIVYQRDLKIPELGFLDFLLGGCVLVVCVLGVRASIAYCLAISDNARNEGLRKEVDRTKSAFLTFAVVWLASFPVSYAIGYAIGKRSGGSMIDLQYKIEGTTVAFQFVIGAIAIYAMVRHLLMYRYAEKFLTHLAEQRRKSTEPKMSKT